MAYWAHGGTLHYGEIGDLVGAMTEVGSLLEVDAGSAKRKAITNTPLAISDHTEVKRAGLITQDAMKIKLLFDKTQHGTLFTLFKAGTLKDWLFTLSDGSTIRRTGFLSEFPVVPKQTNDDELVGDMSLEFSGAATYTAAS